MGALVHQLTRYVRFFLIAALALIVSASRPATAQSATTTTLAVTNGSSAVTSVSAGTVVTLTAKVVAVSASVTPGQVAFCDASVSYCTDIHQLAVAQLTSSGTAVYKFRPGGGSHSYKAVFLGTKTYAASSSSTASLDVTAPFKSVTQIQQSYQDSSWNLTAFVSGGLSTQSLTAPTGAVTFVDTSNANSVLGTVDLSGSKISNGFSYTNDLPSVYSTPPTFFYTNPVVADFDGDGIPDMVTLEMSASQTSLVFYAGNGDGTFKVGSSVTPFSLSQFATISVADFNGDGIPDLGFANTDGSEVIFLGKGDGTFTEKSTVTGGIISGFSFTPLVVTGDFNHDGIPDLLVATGNESLTLWLGKGDGTFTAAAATVSMPVDPSFIQVADFNGDGIPDLLLGGGIPSESSNLYIMLGNGDGTFTTKSSISNGSFDAAEIADFNQDGILDLIVIAGGNFSPLTTTTFKGNGDGTFIQQAALTTTGTVEPGFALGDFNGDGIPDIAVVGKDQSTQPLLLLLGNGNGAFRQVNPTEPTFPGYFNFFGAGDFNGDGLTDLLIQQALPYIFSGGFGTNILSVLLSQSGWTASAAVADVTPSLGTHLISANYAGDSSYMSSSSGTVTLTAQAASITTPASGAILFPSNSTFTWTAGIGVTQYKLDLGTGGQGSSDIYAGVATTATSITVPPGSIPLNGATVTATLYSDIDGTWQPVTTTYMEAQPPALTSPVPGSTLSGSSVTFTGTPGIGVAFYALSVGTYGPGYYNIYGSSQQQANSFTVPVIPTNGKPVYVNLRYQFTDGTWQEINYTYTAANDIVAPVMTSPAPSSTLSGSTVTFNWTPGSGGVTAYSISVGTYGVGYYNIYDSPQLSTTSFTVPGIPTNGKPVYVNLRYQITGGSWQTINYTYTAQ